jgi:hypothetical protein
MITREGGIVLTLKKANRVEIKLAAWPCGSFHRISAAHNRRHSANVQEHERCNVSNALQPALT